MRDIIGTIIEIGHVVLRKRSNNQNGLHNIVQNHFLRSALIILCTTLCVLDSIRVIFIQ